MAKKKSAVKDVFNGETQVVVEDRFNNSDVVSKVHDRLLLDWEGRLAISLLERFALIAAKPGPEDSAGRSTLALLEPQEAVDRAYACAIAMTRKLRDNGHTAMLPTFEEINDLESERG